MVRTQHRNIHVFSLHDVIALVHLPLLQDGGCTCPGDVAKAFGSGADFVMAGGMFAGHTESGGEMIEQNGKKFKLFYGMSSATAMKKHAGGVAEYRYRIDLCIYYSPGLLKRLIDLETPLK